MIKINKQGTITPNIVDKLVLQYPNQDICIVLENTKEQSPEFLEQISRKNCGNTKIIFSVTGGLNPKKEKFNNEHYQKRTYYSPLELSKIIKVYQSIERGIDLSWTDDQKVMYVYQEICNMMEYSEIEVNNRDCARNLLGLLYGKSVCSGFALIFKEALDRLNITNYYQNKQSHHSWNIAYINGAYRAFELTWDTYHKDKDGCGFRYFNRTKDFYKNKHHDIKYEDEETEYNIVPYTDEELIKNYKIINSKKVTKLDISPNEVKEVSLNGRKILVKIKGNEVFMKGVPCKKFARDDGSKFILVFDSKINDLNKLYVLEAKGGKVFIGKIYSEEKLTNLPPEYDSTIANGLLSSERLGRKINQFNGYVGYVGKSHAIYYDQKKEREYLNIIR